MNKKMLVILAMTSSVALAAPRAWIYLDESEDQVWLLNANDIQPAPGWGGDHSHPGALLVSTVHIKVSTFPKFNRELQQRYEGAAKLKIDTGWAPFQSVLPGRHQMDDPKKIAYIESMADTNFLDVGSPLNHEWIAVDCASGDVGITETTHTDSPPNYHASTGTYYGSTNLSVASDN